MENKAELILIRGIPGSGKSTFANRMMLTIDRCCHIEADMFFTDTDGVYTYDRTKIKKAHDWCYTNTVKMLESKVTVIVSNTFTEKWQYQRYVDYAISNDIPYTIITMNGDYGSTHGVPKETVDRMRKEIAASQ